MNRKQQESDDFDENGVLKDGRRIRLPMTMITDAMKRAAEEAFRGLDDGDASILAYDAYGQAAGHRPGLVFAEKPTSVALAADDVARLEATYMTHDVMINRRWLGSRQSESSSPTTVADAYDQYDAALNVAWMKRGAR